MSLRGARRWPEARLLLGVLALVAFLCAAAAPPAATAKKINYAGTLDGDPATTVRFELEVKRDTYRRVTFFDADNFSVTCDDGSSRRFGTLPFGLSFRGPRFFSGQYSLFPGLDEVYVPVTGTLNARGKRATGDFAYILDGTDSPGSTAPGLDCWTAGILEWTAEKVKP